MRILGIDPGLAQTGYGVIEAEGRVISLVEAGIIRTPYREKLEARLVKIYDGLLALIKDARPDAAVIEKLYSHYKHPTTAILMGHVRGVACLAVKKNGLALVEYPAKRVRKALTGRGDATKEQAARMVQAYLRLSRPPEPLDVSDALALAVAHAFILKNKAFSPR